MDSSELYQQLTESIRQQIISGAYQPGSRMPTIRDMAEQMQCAPGTVLRAYQELTRMGLVTSNKGHGTRVTNFSPGKDGQTPLRRASLYNRTEAFLLDLMMAGYSAEEIEQSLRVVSDRWRTYSSQPEEALPGMIRFMGSHDMAMSLLSSHFQDITSGLVLQLTFSGSLGGLIALANHSADMAGCHLWDESTDSYNEPYVRRLLPGQQVAMLTLAHRRLGLIVARGNPCELHSLEDLASPYVRFINRQEGSGTRVWLNAQLRRNGIDTARIPGFENEKMTHSEVAHAVSKGLADAGLGIESSALSLGLDFQPLTTERYDLIIPAGKWKDHGLESIQEWLKSSEARTAIDNLGGYDTSETGTLRWIS